MPNPYYDHTTYPTPNAPGSSAQLRTELDLIEAGFDKLPTLTGNANKVVVVNSGETALTATSTFTGLTFASPTITTPTITGGTINSAVIGGTTPAAGTFTTLSSSGAALTGGTINGVVIGGATPAAGTFTSLAASSATVGGNTVATQSGSETLTNKTISGANNTLSNIGNAALTNSSVTIGSTSVSLGGTAASISGLTLNSPSLSSPAMTGTPTAPTATAGTSTTQVATTAFVQATAFSAALPAQTGNAGKFVTTDGTNASWGAPFTTLLGGGSIPSATGMFIFNDKTDKSYTLSTSLSGINGPVFVLPGSGATYTITVTLSDGWSVAIPSSNASGSPAVVATQSVPSSATAHGVWGPGITATPNVLAQITGLTTSTDIGGVAQLSADLYVVLYGTTAGSGSNVVAVNTATQTVGTPVSLGTANIGSPYFSAVFVESSTNFMLIFINGGGTVFRAGSVSGTTITLGTAQTASTFQMRDRPLQLAVGTYVAASRENTLIAATVSGTTVTLGTAVASGATATTGSAGGACYVRIAPCTSSSFLVAYANAAGIGRLDARVASVSGTTITLNAIGSGPTSNFNDVGNFAALIPLITGSRYIAIGQDGVSATDTRLVGIAVSGTTVTVPSTATNINIGWASNYWTVTSNESAEGYGNYPVSQRSFAKAYNSSTLLVAAGASGQYPAMTTFDGTTVTWVNPDTTFNAAQPSSALGPRFHVNADTQSNYYVDTSNSLVKVTVSGTTFTKVYTLATSAYCTSVFSDTMSDQAVQYSGTWYAWKLKTENMTTRPLSGSRYIAKSSTGTTITIYGNVA